MPSATALCAAGKRKNGNVRSTAKRIPIVINVDRHSLRGMGCVSSAREINNSQTMRNKSVEPITCESKPKQASVTITVAKAIRMMNEVFMAVGFNHQLPTPKSISRKKQATTIHYFFTPNPRTKPTHCATLFIKSYSFSEDLAAQI